MAQEVFKAPNTKRLHPKKDHEGWSPTKKRKGRASLLAFCDIVLEYTQYESMRSQDLRTTNNISPLDSEGGTADSFSSESNSSSFTDTEDSRLGLDGLVNPSATGKTANDDELITCFCMKPYAGRPMIECSQCLTWIHLSCAKIRRKNIPDEFICSQCKDARANKRKSNRFPNASPSFRDSVKQSRRSSPL